MSTGHNAIPPPPSRQTPAIGQKSGIDYQRNATTAVTVLWILVLTIVGLLLMVTAKLKGGPTPSIGWEILETIGHIVALSAGLSFGYELLMTRIREDRIDRKLKELKDDLDVSFNKTVREHASVGLHGIHNGRPSPQFKAEIFQQARREIIDQGTALSAFVHMWSDRPEHEFKHIIMNCLNNGVTYTCVILDHEWLAKMADGTKPETMKVIDAWVEDIKAAREKLLVIAGDTNRNLKAAGKQGRIRVLVYRDLPYFGGLCVDGDEEDGHMLFTPYLHFGGNSDFPTLEVVRSENREYFDKWYRSILFICSIADDLTPSDSSGASIASQKAGQSTQAISV